MLGYLETYLTNHLGIDISGTQSKMVQNKEAEIAFEEMYLEAYPDEVDIPGWQKFLCVYATIAMRQHQLNQIKAPIPVQELHSKVPVPVPELNSKSQLPELNSKALSINKSSPRIIRLSDLNNTTTINTIPMIEMQRIAPIFKD